MARQYILSEVWTEIIRVIDDNMIVDASFQMHYYESRESLEPGYYIAMHRVEDGAVESYVKDCHLVGPLQHKAAADLLHASVLHFGGTNLHRLIKTRMRRFADMPSVSPALLVHKYSPLSADYSL
ncbi:MAG TPA: hypothetical protein VL381_06660 [Rhodocyclaceae bacterium]|jgi:hypothetical protein|nr:hypothetical protein [Rhodocyclaceae bacterium]